VSEAGSSNVAKLTTTEVGDASCKLICSGLLGGD